MQPTNTAPFYNLGVILRETGLKADTLRAWERRYNLPQPTRSEGGQRLYSHRDLEIIQWLMAKQEEGLRISQAADLWHHQISEGVDPLRNTVQIQVNTITPAFSGNNLVDFQKMWVTACKTFDETAAEQIIAEAFSHHSPETVCIDVLFAGLREIGEAWYQGDVSVQQEHFASALVTRRLNALIAGAPLPTRPAKIVVAAPPNEEHTLSALLLTFLLRRRGWDVIFLGADVPLENFRATLETIQPQLVILIAQQLFTAASLLDLVNDLDGLQTTLAFGGRIFNQIPGLSEHIPGHFLGDDLKSAPLFFEQLLRSSGDERVITSLAQPTLPDYFQMMLPAIESHVSTATGADPGLRAVNSHYLSRDILAALKLGDLSYINKNLDWVRGLLSQSSVPAQVLLSFLQIYSQAVEEMMDSRGEPILDWLQNEIDRIAEAETS